MQHPNRADKPERCCFEFCELPATRRLGTEVYFPVCEAHYAEHCAARDNDLRRAQPEAQS